MPRTAEVIIADAGPLIALSRVCDLSLLGGLFEQVWITETVLAECTVRSDKPEGQIVQAAIVRGILQVCPDPPGVSGWNLDPGEASAIATAKALGAGVLMDDRAGRRVAASLGIPVIGVLGLLVLAKEKGKLRAIRPMLEQLTASRYFLPSQLLEDILRKKGE